MFSFENTALIIVDMQNAFCSPEGSFRKRGFRILNLDKVLRISKSIVSLARQEDLLTIFTKIVYDSSYSDAGLLINKIAPEIKQHGGYIEDSWDSEIVDILKPKEIDIIITKKRYDPFYETDLEGILQQNNISNLVVIGLLTNVCVEACIRSAFDRDFHVAIVPEATSTYSQNLLTSSLETIKSHFGSIISYEEILKLSNKYKVDLRVM